MDLELALQFCWLYYKLYGFMLNQLCLTREVIIDNPRGSFFKTQNQYVFKPTSRVDLYNLTITSRVVITTSRIPTQAIK